MTTSRPDFSQAATSILTAAGALFDRLKPQLGRVDLHADHVLEFITEAACYFLHLHDRTLSMPAFRAERAEIMDGLVVALCNRLQDKLRQLGLTVPIEQTADIFLSAYNERQKEYGAFLSQDWLMQVSLRFGQHAAQACDIPPRGEFALLCASQASALYTSLMTSLP